MVSQRSLVKYDKKRSRLQDRLVLRLDGRFQATSTLLQSVAFRGVAEQILGWVKLMLMLEGGC